MATKAKTAEAKGAVVKGKEGQCNTSVEQSSAYTHLIPAEDKVLDYMKKVRLRCIQSFESTDTGSPAQMNRPFGAVDVSANLKGAVPKAAAQKILVALAERGDLVQKTCGTHICTRSPSQLKC